MKRFFALIIILLTVGCGGFNITQPVAELVLPPSATPTPTTVPELVLLPTDAAVTEPAPTATTLTVATDQPVAAQTPAAAPTATLLPTLTATGVPATAITAPTETPLPTATALPTETPLPTATVQPEATVQPPATALPTATLLPTTTTIPTEPPATAEPVPTDAPPVPTATVAPPTPTLAPTDVPPTPVADNGNDTPPQIVSFEPGAISTRLEGQMLAGTRTYTLRALEGQQVLIFLDATNDTPNFSFSGLEDGMPIKRVANEDRRLSVRLPSTQDYKLTVHALAETYFWLDVVILPPGEVMPQTGRELVPWLAGMRQRGFSQATLEAALKATNQMPEFYAPIELTSGSGDEVWFASVVDAGADNFAREGDMGIISAEGTLLFQYSDYVAESAGNSAPTLFYPLDLTGDGRIDPLLVSEFCGAHTCFQHYDVFAYDGSSFRLISPQGNGDGTDPIANSNSNMGFGNQGEGTLNELYLHGGTFNSAGAGPYQRTWTDTWRYDSGADMMVNTSTVFADSNYRFHLLHDANSAWDAQNWGIAATNYLRVINDDTLEDGVGVTLYEENTRDSTKLFAAFRLMVYSLLQGDADAAQTWRSWIETSQFATASQVPAATAIFWDSYNVTAPGDIVTACTAVRSFLEPLDTPTGAVGYLGYQLPPLGAEDVCPVQ